MVWGQFLHHAAGRIRPFAGTTLKYDAACGDVGEILVKTGQGMEQRAFDMPGVKFIGFTHIDQGDVTACEPVMEYVGGNCLYHVVINNVV